MDVLFLHPNFPGQFRRFASAMAREEGIRVLGVGDTEWMKSTVQLQNVPAIGYPTPDELAAGVHPYARSYDAAVRRGRQVVDTLLKHKREGLEPDVIFVHPGWGDGFYLKDVFPGARIIGLFEYYYRARGADVGFDPEFPMSFDDIFRVRSLNAVQLMALESCDDYYCPTEWQRSCFPPAYRERIRVIHDGIDTTKVAPDHTASITLPGGQVLTARDEVVTYVSRNLEPYRGYHTFMRALPQLMAERPNCHVVIVGADGVSYGKRPPIGETWKQRYLDEVADRLDLSRLHFTGALPYDEYLKVLQISSAHVYLTYPFILSWSMLEAMSAACLLIASATPPVEEVVRHGENGLLFSFRDHRALAQQVIEALQNPERYRMIRESARQTIIDRYDAQTICIPAFKQLLNAID